MNCLFLLLVVISTYSHAGIGTLNWNDDYDGASDSSFGTLIFVGIFFFLIYWLMIGLSKAPNFLSRSFEKVVDSGNFIILAIAFVICGLWLTSFLGEKNIFFGYVCFFGTIFFLAYLAAKKQDRQQYVKDAEIREEKAEQTYQKAMQETEKVNKTDKQSSEINYKRPRNAHSNAFVHNSVLSAIKESEKQKRTSNKLPFNLVQSTRFPINSSIFGDFNESDINIGIAKYCSTCLKQILKTNNQFQTIPISVLRTDVFGDFDESGIVNGLGQNIHEYVWKLMLANTGISSTEYLPYGSNYNQSLYDLLGDFDEFGLTQGIQIYSESLIYHYLLKV